MMTDVVVRLRTASVTWRQVDGEAVALDLTSGEYLAINATGAMLWSALIDGASIAALVDLLRQRYGIDEVQAHADVKAFVDDLDVRGLLTYSGSP